MPTAKKNVEEDEEFELKNGREDITLYIEFRSVQTFQENRRSSLAMKVIKPGTLDQDFGCKTGVRVYLQH